MEEEEEPHPSQPLLPNGEEHSRRKLIMANLKDSLLSHLSESNPSLKTSNASSSIIQRRLHHLFTSFNTPTHPPYALMIHRAITELNEENGSTEEAISDFIRKEYDDLPWAHGRILGIQLEKLCQDKELVCNEDGRYVLVADGGDRVGNGGKEEAEECKRSGKKRKRDKKRNDHDNVDGLAGERKRKEANRGEVVERVDELQEGGGIKEQVLLHGSDSARSDEPIRVVVCAQENGELALNQSIERVEEQAKSEKGLTEVVGKRNQSQRQGTGVVDRRHMEAESPAQESQLLDSILQSETNCSSQPTALDALVDSRQPPLLPSSKCVPSAATELSLTQMKLQMTSSLDVSEQKQDENPVSSGPKQHCLKRLRRGRPPKSKPTADSQGDSLIPLRDVIINALKPNRNKIKKQWQSQPLGRGIGRGRPRKQNRILKREVVLACVNVHHEQPPHHGNQRSPKGNFHENPVSWDAKQNPPKRPRGRPKIQTVANDQEVLILSSDDGIPSEKKPNINKMEKQHQDGWGRGRGKGKGRGRRGRPPIVNGNVNHHEKKLQREDQAQQPGRGRGGGRGGSRGRGRGRGRPPILNGSANHYEKQLQTDDQAQQHGRARGRGRGRGRGRPKLNRNEGLVSISNPVGDDNQSLEQKQLQLQSQEKQSHQQQDQGWDQNQDVGQGRPSNPVLDANKEPPAASPIGMLRSTSGHASATKLETESNSPENYIAS